MGEQTRWLAEEYGHGMAWRVVEVSPRGGRVIVDGLTGEQARLIAAAPDMYEALEIAQDALKTVREQFNVTCPKEVYAAVDGALAKAQESER